MAVVRGEEELFGRTAHLFAAATEVSCAANDLHTWASGRPREDGPRPARTPRLRKLFRLDTLLDPTWGEHVRRMAGHGADVRVSTSDVSETIVLDRRVVILAGDRSAGERAYSVITQPTVVHGVVALFEAAWRAGTALAVHEAGMAELRPLVPGLLDALNSGATDEAAARALRISVRTYRRRVAELMAALGATSRFQAGARARELGLV
ncbi:DNA-binding response regulator [Actinosynnema sp. NPDC020468]|uniref:DNA-binding response regulator n=1 Tax=Actinosynnema sp. NPDC020468 TaxID=3154488 RepID=UPI003408A7A8